MTEPNLRFPAVFCENLRFCAKICASKCLNFQEKGWIFCENLRFSAKICVLGSLCHLSSVPLSSHRWSSSTWRCPQATQDLQGSTVKAMCMCLFQTTCLTTLRQRQPLDLVSKTLRRPFLGFSVKAMPWPFNPCFFFRFPCFFRFPIFLAFSCVFPSFSNDFRGSTKRKTLVSLGKNLCFLQKKQGLEGQGGFSKTAGCAEGGVWLYRQGFLNDFWSRSASGGCLQGVQVLREKRLIFRAAKPAEVCWWNFWWNLIWNLKFPMGKIWWNFWGGLFRLPRKDRQFRGEFRGKFRSKFRGNFRKLRFKFRDFFRKLRSAEGRC